MRDINARIYDAKNDKMYYQDDGLMGSMGWVCYMQFYTAYKDRDEFSNYSKPMLRTDKKDSSGRYIYEGDIIKDDMGSLGFVEWNDNHGAWYLICISGQGNGFLYEIKFWKLPLIIGNIHQNKLLEEVE